MKNIRTTLIAATFLIGSSMSANARTIDFDFDDHEDLLEQLIELDAEDINDLRDDFADARADIAEAVVDVEEARAEIESENGLGRAIAKIAFGFASTTVDVSVNAAFGKLQTELDLAEKELGVRRTDLGEAEFKETQGAITMIRTEISAIESALEDLTQAFDDA